MPQHSAVSEYFSGQGNVLASDIDASGSPTGYRLLGNVSVLGIQNNITSFDHREATTGQRAIDLRLTQALDVNLSMTIESFTNENITLSLFGDNTVIPAAVGATISTKPVILGLVYSLDKLNVTNVVGLDASTGLITYVEGLATNPLANYTLDEAAGSVLIHADQSGAAVPLLVGEVIDFTFDHADQNLINAQTQPRPVIALRFEGLNTAKGNEPVVVDIFRFNTDPLAEFNMLNEEVWQGELNGIALQDPTKIGGSQFYTIRKL